MASSPVVNTHVHCPPNFSAFSTLDEVVAAAADQQVRALGISNFYNQDSYPSFGQAARARGIVPLFGLEFISLVSDLEQRGVRINDPANPGRMYLCGKGIAPTPVAELDESVAAVAAQIRADNDSRSHAMVTLVADRFAAVGLDTGLDAPTITAQVAERAQVPPEWVSLQERHIAQAFADAVAALPAQRCAAVLEAAYGTPSTVDPTDATALQAEVRSRLLKAGTPGFVAEAPLAFEVARDHVLARGGIPCYPTLADGVDPVCEFEADPNALAHAVVERGFAAAELIPNRNHARVVDRYVQAFTAAGLIVMAGTEHNTPDQIPFEVTCVDGPVSAESMAAFWRGTCVVAAHQSERRAGRDGYVNALGEVVGDADELAALGAAHIAPDHASQA